MAVLRVRGVPDDTAASATPETGSFSDIVDVSTTHSLRTGAVRGAAEQAIEVSDDQVVALDLDGGIRLITSVSRLRETMEWSGVRGAGDELLLPDSLQVGPASRGAGRWAYHGLKLLNVDLGKKTTDQAVNLLEGRLLGTSPDEAGRPAGILFRCTTPLVRGETITAADQLTTASPLLLFLHGTASSTSGSFGGLVERDAQSVWERLRARYGRNILAFDHATLSASPITNALQLVELLPDGATVHIVSHSRGGLIGELLCRSQRTDLVPDAAAPGPVKADPFDDVALALFADRKYERELASLQRLGERLKQKQIRVQRFVRVACPARGTTLASGRLDFYLSIVFNAIGLIPGLRANPVYEFTTALLASVAKQRTDPRALPGIEAMMPTSALVGALNDPRVRVAADLTAITGDTERGGVLKTLQTFVSDLFYRENHDLVVQTSAMTGGAVRDAGARFHFAKGSGVDHFRYFRNPETAEKVLRGLTRADASDDGFERITTTTAAELKTRAPVVVRPGTRPVAFVVPGIMGSHLGRAKNRFWIDLIDIARGKFGDLDIERTDVEAQALVGRSYDHLVTFLQATHEVVPFPFDWRRSVLESADRLRDAVVAKLGETKHPVRIVAHSMGGLVARAMFARHPELRDEFAARAGSRLLMLGTPNGGSYSIPRVLLGQDQVMKYLVLLDFKRGQEDLLRLIARFTGVLQLLPAVGPDNFFGRGVWDGLKAAFGEKWVAPSEADLMEAMKLWTLLLNSPGDPRFMTYVAGRAPATPIAYQIDLSRKGSQRIQFLATREGDGRVPWATGRLADVPTWYVQTVHGDMANDRTAFRAYHELLEKGTTKLLPDQPPADTRGETTFMVMPEDEADLFPDDDALIAAAFGFENRPDRDADMAPLVVSVAHGNLAYARDAVAVGHYFNDTLAGAEATLDRHLCGALSERRQLGLYPGAVETADVFLRDEGKPAGAIVVGLGDVGWLTPGKLERSFTHAVLRYASVVAQEDPCSPSQVLRTANITTLLIGSGRGGIPMADSIRAIVNGTLHARAALRGTPLEQRVHIDRLEFLELFEDVAISATRELRVLERDTSFSGRIHVQPRLRTLPGARRRATYDESDGWWDRLQIRSVRGGGLRFNNLTQRARSEVRLVPTQRTVVDHFVRGMTGSTNQDTGLAQTLFDLLVPNALKEYAPDRNALVLLLDADSARYPWELLQDRSQQGADPIAVRSGLIRQLEEVKFRENVVTATGNDVLVVGDPPTHLPPLPGARREAQAVAEALAGESLNVTSLIGSDFAAILNGLYASSYRLIHLAGHGVLEDPPAPPKDRAIQAQDVSMTTTPRRPKASATIGGMVIGDRVYLTTGEIEQLRVVPEVVFINCCHIGSMQSGGHPLLAATIARQLIRMGVRAVVAAGWAVEDEPAVTFARTFYENLLGQVPFGDAVLAARRATYRAHPASNTWGAYQCYGDQGFIFRSGRPAEYTPRDRADFVSTTELIVALDNLSQDADITSQAGLTELRKRLAALEEAVPTDWRNRADVRAALGRACAQLDLFRKGIRSYGPLREARKADYTVTALEQLANITSRYAVELWQRRGRPDEARSRLLRRVIERAIEDLEILPSRTPGGAVEVGSRGRSGERWSLIASGWKRLSHISGDFRIGALAEAERYYTLAEEKSDSFYPRLNRIACEILLERLTDMPAARNLDDALREAERLTTDSERDDPDFWSGAAVADAAVLRGILTDDLAERANSIIERYANAWRRGGSPQKLRSVLEHIEWLIECLDAEPPTTDPDARRAETLRALRDILDRTRGLAEG